MWQAWVKTCLTLGDLLLGWSLAGGPEGALAAAVAASVLVMVAVRWMCTPQRWLQQVAQDRKVLRQRKAAARRAKDQETFVRIRDIQSMLAWRRAPWELWSALCLTPFLLGVATWAAERAAFQPIQPGEVVELTLFGPYAWEHELVHLLPTGVTCADGYIRRMSSDSPLQPPQTEAVWRLRVEKDATACQIRHTQSTIQHPLRCGAPYPPVEIDHGEARTRLALRPMDCFGWLRLPPWIATYAPPWMIVYLSLTLPLGAWLQSVVAMFASRIARSPGSPTT